MILSGGFSLWVRSNALIRFYTLLIPFATLLSSPLPVFSMTSTHQPLSKIAHLARCERWCNPQAPARPQHTRSHVRQSTAGEAPPFCSRWWYDSHLHIILSSFPIFITKSWQWDASKLFIASPSEYIFHIYIYIYLWMKENLFAHHCKEKG